MTTHRITLLAGWYQVVETRTDGTETPIGSFRTETDAKDWLNTYLRMQTGAEVFKVGYSKVPAASPAEAAPPITTEPEAD
jgi:hypothetical protein